MKDSGSYKLIFYQSIASIDYILHILKKSKKNSCLIIVTGGKHFFEIIHKLNLKKKFGVEIFDFTQPKISNFYKVLNFFYKIKFGNIIKKLNKYEFSEAYFNCYNTDFVTPVILSILNINKIFFCEYKLGMKLKKKSYFQPNFKWLLKTKILQFLLFKYSVTVNYSSNDGFRRINFKAANKRIYKFKLPILTKDKKFLLPLNLTTKKKRKAIFLDAYQENSIGPNYAMIIGKLLRILNYYDFEVIVKKHANVPLSNCFKNITKKNLISSVIPIELYNLENINLVIGISSIGQAYVSSLNPNIKVISCLFILFKNDKQVNENIQDLDSIYKFLLARDVNKKIFFPKTINEIELFLKKL